MARGTEGRQEIETTSSIPSGVRSANSQASSTRSLPTELCCTKQTRQAVFKHTSHVRTDDFGCLEYNDTRGTFSTFGAQHHHVGLIYCSHVVQHDLHCQSSGVNSIKGTVNHLRLVCGIRTITLLRALLSAISPRNRPHAHSRVPFVASYQRLL